MTLEEVLIMHSNCYPKMQIQDIVKLIYQNEFGGGHLIKDKKDSLVKLEQEFYSLKKHFTGSGKKSDKENGKEDGKKSDKENGREDGKKSDKGSGRETDDVYVSGLFEDIGNNLLRLNLLPLLMMKWGNTINSERIGNNIESNRSNRSNRNNRENKEKGKEKDKEKCEAENKEEIKIGYEEEIKTVNKEDNETVNKEENYLPIEITTINSFFVNTANSISGEKERFIEKLEIFRKCCKDGLLPFSATDADSCLDKYKARGYPAESHSEIYRLAYKPAYRIVEARYRYFFEIFCRIDSLLRTKDRVDVAIDGNCSAGKSTLADFIGNVYDCNIFHMDDFFLPHELKTKERLDEAGGNVDYARFKEEVINGISSGREFRYRKYDCKSGKFQEIVKINPKKLNIIEGSYSMHHTLIKNYDLKIFLGIDKEGQRRRILKRNGPGMYKMFMQLWIPLENRYFSEMRIREQSDLVYE